MKVHKSDSITLRISPDVARALDAEAEHLGEAIGGIAVSRTQVARRLILDALASRKAPR